MWDVEHSYPTQMDSCQSYEDAKPIAMFLQRTKYLTSFFDVNLISIQDFKEQATTCIIILPQESMVKVKFKVNEDIYDNLLSRK